MATRISAPGDLGSIDVSRIRGVVFDLVGTLMRPVPSAAEAYRAAGARLGHALSAAEAAARFRAAFSRQEAVDRQRHGLRTSQQRECERWQAIVAEVFPEAEPGGPLFADLWAHFGRGEHWCVFDDVPAALQSLRKRGYRLAIGSNFDERLHPLVRNSRDLAEFAADEVFDSATVGWRKPAPEFFLALENALQLPASALLMVGDDLENDVNGALAAGWQALAIRQPGEPSCSAPLAPLVERFLGNRGPG
jgi:putative hydrolase of the HAD superfamily